jgi:hypothetical protein
MRIDPVRAAPSVAEMVKAKRDLSDTRVLYTHPPRAKDEVKQALKCAP